MNVNNELPSLERHLSPPESTEYSSKIDEAHKKIDNLRFKESSDIYIKLLEELKQEDDIDKKNKTIQELHKLYDKLNLYQNIVYFQESLRKKDHEAIQKHVKNITENYNNLRKSNVNTNSLMDLARENHKRYLEFLENEDYMPKY